jgi:diacylglycerol kinase family enzyme
MADTGIFPLERPLFIVQNPGSGRADAEEARSVIARVLTEAGQRHSFRVPKEPQLIARVARETLQEAERVGGGVVVAGGDGTLRCVADAVLGSRCPFGVIPQGTFNYFARSQGIPEDTALATRALVGATTRPVQVGLVNERAFLVNASIGLYPELLEDREAAKARLGRSRLVAIGAGIKTLLGEHRALLLEVEHASVKHVIRTPTLVVDNNRLQLEQMGLPEAEVIEEGQLVAFTVREEGRAALLGLAARGALGQLGDAHAVTRFAFRKMVVRPRFPLGLRRIKVATDGEVTFLRTPLTFRVARARLQLLVPADSSERGAESLA